MSEGINRCRTCIHWNKAVEFGRQCACEAYKIGESVDNDGLWNDAATSNYIYTGPDFGCGHHESQP